MADNFNDSGFITKQQKNGQKTKCYDIQWYDDIIKIYKKYTV